MIEKRVKVAVPENLIASELLSFVTNDLSELLKIGWKIGGVIHTRSLNKTVILYRNTADSSSNYYPESSFQSIDGLIYSLQHNKKDDGARRYSKGKPIMCNDVTIKVQKAFGSEMPEEHLKELIEHLCKEANNWLFDKYGFNNII